VHAEEKMKLSGPISVRLLIAIAAITFTAVFSIHRLDRTPYEINFGATFHELLPILTSTLMPAIKLCLIWAIGSAIVAGAILRFDPEIGLFDAALGGAAGVWLASYLLGQILGPVGLFNATMLRLLLLAGTLWLVWRPPHIRRLKLSGGQKLALISFGLLAFGLLPAQLGSPVAPYMDVLTYPAAVQRILSFHVYLPFDNDAFGCWGTRAQTPALELFFSGLALIGGVKLGVLAQSQIMTAMAGLVIFSTYRLGLALVDDIAGGSAALLLFFTTEFRRLTGMRGTALAFALVAIGLGFLFDRDWRPTRAAMGALILGLAIPSHAIDGGLGMLVAAFGAILYLIAGQQRRFLITFVCLLGASLLALPGVVIGLGLQFGYALRVGAMLLGVAIIIGTVCCRQIDQDVTLRPLKWLQQTLIFAIIAAWIYLDGIPNSMVPSLIHEYPVLSMLAFAGLVATAVSAPSVGTLMLLFALMLEPAYEAINHFAISLGGPVFQSAFGDIGVKLQDYWCPFFLAVLAGVVCSRIWRTSRSNSPFFVVILLILLIYPWNERLSENYNYFEHSIAEEWGIDYGLAMRGFWITTGDSRWTEGASGTALIDFMRSEIKQHRVTASTHVLHIARNITVLGDFNRYSVFTGIDDDPVVYDVSPMDVGWIAGSRVRRAWELPRLLATQPQYILDQTNSLSFLPAGYDMVFTSGSLRLYRKRPM
jgi:hypothetical protein